MKVNLSLTAAERHPFGRLLNHLYYSNEDLVDIAPDRSGFPHNGGEHTLRIVGDHGDVIAWLDLFLGNYPTSRDYIYEIKKQIRSKLLEGSVSINIILKNLPVYQAQC